MRRPISHLALVLAVGWLVFPVAAGALSFSGIVAFGDSLTDVGNLCPGTGCPPSPPYATGRFSNGPIWVDDLSAGLGLGPVTASNDGGSDYAVGGATTSDLAGQIAAFSASTVGKPPNPNDLYIVWAGGNDVLGSLFGSSSITMTQAAQNVADAITTLNGLGAQYFLVPNLPNIGLTPAAIAAGASNAANQLSQAFNAALAQDLAGLGGVTVYAMDVYTQVNAVEADPSTYGFTDVSDPCFNGSTVCATPDTYLYWDSVHPTAAAHDLLALGALLAVPEPGSLLLLLVAGASFAWVRGRRALG